MGRFWKLNSLLGLCLLSGSCAYALEIGTEKYTPVYTLKDDRSASVINENFRRVYDLISTATTASAASTDPLQWHYVEKTSNYTIQFDTETVIGCNVSGGNIRIDAPSGAPNGRIVLIFKDEGSGNTCTIGAGSDSINGSASTISRSTGWTGYLMLKYASGNWAAWAIAP